MKKFLKAGIALAAVGMVGAGVTVAATCSNYNKEAAQVIVEEQGEETVTNLLSSNFNGASAYNGEKLISGKVCNHEFKYSDGYFMESPSVYNSHMATTSMVLTNLSDMKVVNGDYTHGADDLVAMYEKMGFTTIYVSDSYKEIPTEDSIGCVIAMKVLSTGEKLVSITIRSAGYDLEWASNVLLGTEGEAKGFASAADQVVYKYFKEFTEQNNLTNDLESGNVKFWVSGFSRGGATANLTAKRLVDDYQTKGNKVYAYCIEAPRGGVKEKLMDRDYTGIHNIVNNSDLVVHVAPLTMGFIRYGVEHNLIGSAADSAKINPFSNADNYEYIIGGTDYNTQYNKMVAQADAMGTKARPYNGTLYKLSLSDFSIKEENCTNAAEYVAGNLMNMLGKNTNRKEYVNGGAEKAAFDLMKYMYGGGLSISDLVEQLTYGKSLYDLMPIRSVISSALSSAKVESKGSIWDLIKNLICDRDEVELTLDLTNGQIEDISKGFVDNLFAQKYDITKLANLDKIKEILNGTTTLEEAMRVGVKIETLFVKYPGGINQAKKDTVALLKVALKNTSDINFIVNVAKNIGGIMDNHSMNLTEAWLRSYDNFYDLTDNLWNFQ